MEHSTKGPLISSPVATGGAGTIFEQHVVAHWFALLLVQAIPPILLDCRVTEVWPQAEQLGWSTDDVLVTGGDATGGRRRLACQVKRRFTISAADAECVKAIADFWKDFRNGELFSPAADRLALITLRGTNTLLEHFVGLLDCARAAGGSDEFAHRFDTPGLLHSTSKTHYAEIKKIVTSQEGAEVSEASLWAFLRVIHVLSLDLNSATAQSEASIKSLLAHTTHEPNPIAVAASTWSSLLEFAGKALPESRRCTLPDLPAELRQRHPPAGSFENPAILALRSHSAPINDGIHTTLRGGMHLPREVVVQQLLQKLESDRIVLLTGSAGSGKSAVAKDALAVLSDECLTFSFRAEEFKRSHLDETLSQGHIPVGATAIGAILAGQGRKVLWVESVERLLEASTRDAFTDLLNLVAKDSSWRLILTCRKYSADLFRRSFLEATRTEHAIVKIPPLSDSELSEVQATFTQLAPVFANPVLRELLRNLYILDKALLIHWGDGRPLPHSEREFRQRFWQDVVRDESHAAQGLPQRREEAFVEITLRRARSLTLYIPSNGLDAEIVTALCTDSLVAKSQKSSALVAPAHDVLEDWAILHWINEQAIICEYQSQRVAELIGNFPAIRRTYREWVGELIEISPSAAESLFHAAMKAGNLPAAFRDDTMVALLRAPMAAAFLDAHAALLLQNDAVLIVRIIQLLRVACVMAPSWLPMSSAQASIFNVPEGDAWASVLRMVAGNIQKFSSNRYLLLLGFIEDWAKGIHWQHPYPPGSESAATIALTLLPSYLDYSDDDERSRVLKVLAKIPNANAEAFKALLRVSDPEKSRDRVREDLTEIILEGIDGAPVARDFPQLVADLIKAELLYNSKDLDRFGFGSGVDLEPLFGIRSHIKPDYFPPSAIRGPFLPLLRSDPGIGMSLIIDVLNLSATWYAKYYRFMPSIEPPDSLLIRFADGKEKLQGSNGRLWSLYRGTSVGPYVLQSMLMAIECWLQEIAQSQPALLDRLLQKILRRSETAALTAVVAAISTQFPQHSTEALLTILRSPGCFELDRHRLVNEASAPSGLASLLPDLTGRHGPYNKERKESDELPHRKQHLEHAVLNLQLGQAALDVHHVLDDHRASLPAAEDQTEDDLNWRLALHRMDLRNYSAGEVIESPPNRSNALAKKHFIKLNAKQPDADLQKVLNQSAPEIAEFNARSHMQIWAHKAFEWQLSPSEVSNWRPLFAEALKTLTVSTTSSDPDFLRSGPGLMAAVCARDHWNELTAEERIWCIDVICSEVVREADYWNQLQRVQRNSMSPDRAGALILPKLLTSELSNKQRARVLECLAVALTHSNDEVRAYAAAGVGSHLWATEPKLALRCANGLAYEADIVQTYYREHRNEMFGVPGALDNLEAEIAKALRPTLFEENAVPTDAILTIDAKEWIGAQAYVHVLRIIVGVPAEPKSIDGFKKAAQLIADWWKGEDERRRTYESRTDHNHDDESRVIELLVAWAMESTLDVVQVAFAPLFDAVDKHPEEVCWLILQMIAREDSRPNPSQFWAVWQMFADRVAAAPWIKSIDHKHSDAKRFLSYMFLANPWNEGTTHWPSLEGRSYLIEGFFLKLPPALTVLDYYARFLFRVGSQSLPNAFEALTFRIRDNPGLRSLDSNTVYILEIMLQRHVYSQPHLLKADAEMRESILFLLELLIERGSSAAFRMRDDFVTPLRENSVSCQDVP